MLEHLLSRYMDPCRSPSVCYDDTEASFLLWNLSGQLVGYQRYSPGKPKKEKYFSYTVSNMAVWGLETLNYSKPLFLTEGVFDAARLHWYGLPAVALLSCNPKHLANWLDCLPVHKVSCVQGDSAGRLLASYGDSPLYLPEGEDVNSLSEPEFLKMFERFL